MSLIYLITNSVNGKKYVGKTTRKLWKRWSQHKVQSRCAKYAHYALYKAMNKYGVEAFTIEVIAESLPPFLDALESIFIKLHNSRSYANGYNMTAGGDGVGAGTDHPLFGKKQSTETVTKAKRNRAFRTRPLDQSYRTEEWKAKLGEIQRERWERIKSSPSYNLPRTKRKGMPPRSAEHKAKLSAGRKGYKTSPESIAKRTASRAANRLAARNADLQHH